MSRVVLLGWANATTPQLRVFERLYASLGLEPLSVIASITRGLLATESYTRAAEPLARTLEADRGARPTIVHVFSDNGFATWGALLALLSSTERGRLAIGAVRGIVFDSSPGVWAVRGKLAFARYLAVGTASIVGSRLGRDPSQPMWGLTTALLPVFIGYRMTFRRAARSVLTSVGHVRALQPVRPNLYLYGSADPIVLPRNVRAWVTSQRARGISCEVHEFDAASHVGLYPNDPDRYRTLVDAFVSSTLADAPRRPADTR